MKSLRNTIVTALLGVAFLAGCADGPLAPDVDVRLSQAEAPGGNGGNGGNGGDTTSGSADLIKWITPLPQDVTTLGLCLAGKECSIRIDEVGAVISIPRNALSSTTVISMTALAGDDVNFRFAPHGLQFNRDVKIKVDQEKTGSHGVDFTAFYWVDDVNDVRDQINATVKHGSIEFYTDHFSGYALGM